MEHLCVIVEHLQGILHGICYILSVYTDRTWSPFNTLKTVNNTRHHQSDVIMGTIASQITSLTIVYSIVYSDADQSKHQSSASLAFVRGIHRGPVNSPHKCNAENVSIWWRHHDWVHAIFKCIRLKEEDDILLQISPKFVVKGSCIITASDEGLAPVTKTSDDSIRYCIYTIIICNVLKR